MDPDYHFETELKKLDFKRAKQAGVYDMVLKDYGEDFSKSVKETVVADDKKEKDVTDEKKEEDVKGETNKIQ